MNRIYIVVLVDDLRYLVDTLSSAQLDDDRAVRNLRQDLVDIVNVIVYKVEVCVVCSAVVAAVKSVAK